MLAVLKNEDSTSFAIEACELFEQSQLYGQYSISSLNRLKDEIKILKIVKEKYGIENLDPYNFSLEDGEMDYPLYKKIFDAILHALQKLLLAVTNFIHSVANFISSRIVKSRIQYYEKFKSEVPALLNHYKKNKKAYKDFKVYIPAIDLKKFILKLPEIPHHYSKLNKTIEDLLNTGEKIINEIIKDGERTPSLMKLGVIFVTTNPGAALKLLSATSHKAKDFIKKMMGDLLFGSAAAINYVQNGLEAKLAAPGTVAKYIFYDVKHPKKREIDLDEYFTLKNNKNIFSILDAKFVDALDKYCKEMKNSGKMLDKITKNVGTLSHKLSKIYSLWRKERKGTRTVRNLMRAVLENIAFARLLSSFFFGISLNVMKEFLRQQNYAYTAFRILISSKSIYKK
jgi:hypothetical protein